MAGGEIVYRGQRERERLYQRGVMVTATIKPSIDELHRQMFEIKQSLEEITRAVLGYNGTQGIVTKIALIEQKVETISQNGCQAGRTLHTRKDDPNESNSVTFKWIMEKMFVPVTTAIITAVLVAAVINYLKP